MSLWVPESVLNPALLPTGVLLAEAAVAAPGQTLLDLGCGTGIVGLAFARSGREAVSSDLNPAAVRAAQVNAMLNDLALVARAGDLFEPHRGRRFDLIAFNPPFFERDQGGPLQMALADGPGLPLFGRFLRELPEYLNPGGRALIAGSTNGALGSMRAHYQAAGFRHRVVRWSERLAERLVVDELTR
jgi:HemK-related putative methylase